MQPTVVFCFYVQNINSVSASTVLTLCQMLVCVAAGYSGASKDDQEPAVLDQQEHL